MTPSIQRQASCIANTPRKAGGAQAGANTPRKAGGAQAGAMSSMYLLCVAVMKLPIDVSKEREKREGAEGGEEGVRAGGGERGKESERRGR